VIVGVGYLFTGWILNGGYYLMILIQWTYFGELGGLSSILGLLSIWISIESCICDCFVREDGGD
jgi:hypothetical protein